MMLDNIIIYIYAITCIQWHRCRLHAERLLVIKELCVYSSADKAFVQPEGHAWATNELPRSYQSYWFLVFQCERLWKAVKGQRDHTISVSRALSISDLTASLSGRSIFDSSCRVSPAEQNGQIRALSAMQLIELMSAGPPSIFLPRMWSIAGHHDHQRHQKNLCTEWGLQAATPRFANTQASYTIIRYRKSI